MPPTPYTNQAAATVAKALLARTGATAPRVGLILGSGLGDLARDVQSPHVIPFADIPGFADAQVAGHAGQLILGMLGTVPVALLSGRLHLYQGHPPAQVGFPVRLLRALGAPILFVSNAAGGINRAFTPGDLMVIEDHINLTGRAPLVGPADIGDTRFTDMSAPYDAALRTMLHEEAARLGIPLHEGVYAGVVGPSYETRAEVRMLAHLGADAVGMSTVGEVIVARAMGVRVVGVSCITNMASGIAKEPLDHEGVLRVAGEVAERFRALVNAFVARL